MSKLEKQPPQPATDPADRRGGTRRRGAALEDALLNAAWAELHSTGYARLTMEAVAERARTSRAVIYRRWSSRAELVIAAMRHNQPLYSDNVPDTGTLRSDALDVLRRASSRISTIGPDTVVGLLGDLLADEEAFDYIQAQLLRGGTEVMTTVLARAATRDEARPGISPRVARLPLDLLRHELILTRQPPSQRTIHEIVDDVFLPLVQRER